MATQTDPKTPVASPRKGRKAGVVNELSVFLKVKPGRERQIPTSFDGDWDVYIDDFARTLVLQERERFLIYCKGYPDAADVASVSLFQKRSS
jgi:hypothetical protein